MLILKFVIIVEGKNMLCVEVIIDKLNIKKFLVGYINVLIEELDKWLGRKFGDVDVKVRFVGVDGLIVLGGVNEDKKMVEEIL